MHDARFFVVVSLFAQRLSTNSELYNRWPFVAGTTMVVRFTYRSVIVMTVMVLFSLLKVHVHPYFAYRIK